MTATTVPEPAAVPDIRAEIHETHTGVVVLMGERAYKLKKPVVTDFLDFSTAERREQVCRREIELNGRLAPRSYLGVAHLHLPDQPPEPMVVMRRYPDRDRLRSMVLRGERVEPPLAALADLLARFHAGAVRSGTIDACATVAEVGARWQANLTELAHYAGDVVADEAVSEVGRLALRYLDGRAALFDDRIAAHRIVDGHGDLQTDDVFCTPDGPLPLDCLEFDDQLRFVDGIDDAAFLAMDLEFLGRRDLAEQFLLRYREQAGDPAPRSLVDFYIAYRAVVRAKVDCIRVTQGRRDAAADAAAHLDVARVHLRAATVRLVLVGGGPGTGKTTVSHELAAAVGAQVISTDAVRRELQESGAIDGPAGEVDAGLYAPAKVAVVYETVLTRAAELLAHGESVILDGTWRDPQQRSRARVVADQGSAVPVEFVCATGLPTAQERIEHRVSATSDATAHIAAEITAGTWAGAHLLDTGRPAGDSVTEALQVWNAAT